MESFAVTYFTVYVELTVPSDFEVVVKLLNSYHFTERIDMNTRHTSFSELFVKFSSDYRIYEKKLWRHRNIELKIISISELEALLLKNRGSLIMNNLNLL